MAWRVVRALETLRDQINAAAPNRSKAGDGTIGDDAHVREGSTSDHNPHVYSALGATPVVCALDITHDPAHGCDSYALADAVRASHDPRIAYIISNRRIASSHAVGSAPAWAWRTYTGTGDPHTGHAHFSTVHDARADQTQPFRIGIGPTPTEPPEAPMFLRTPNGSIYLAAGGRTVSVSGTEWGATSPQTYVSVPQSLADKLLVAAGPTAAQIAAAVVAALPGADIDEAVVVAALQSDQAKTLLTGYAKAGTAAQLDDDPAT